MRVGVGADFIITQHYALHLMGSLWLSGTVFPPQSTSDMLDYQPPSRRRTSAHEGRRIRPERHNPHSIATLRILIAHFLLQQIYHCPRCGSPPEG